ncbi:hypothetical protein Bb109J_c0303 [Bdellovibrio bacteriovorus]|uniref:hypothetical protein n=1 Tax=Bdellovibrio bacteriovorus TaxID=959 RepID=UPI00045C0625|nr:hypothetical protein [Bdellovibrio bacteriovorus]AHZ85962.1 hypothetical protein EP01_13600 [Bdellovibrio bacteriovorus]BEV66883.1 hypothetical protein Bb109J_c0303 [Bdellovibrio bacteriovorus]
MSFLTPEDTSVDIAELRKSGHLRDHHLIEMNQSIDEKVAIGLIKNRIFGHIAFKHTKEQGDSFEEVVDYFLRSCGLFLNVKHNSSNRVHQIDHLARFSNHVREVVEPITGHKNFDVIGESKNYRTKCAPMGVDIVYKVEGLKLICGAVLAMYFTRGGLTGNEITAATALAGDFSQYSTPKTLSVVFSDDDWKYLESKPKMFNRLLFYKMDQFKFHKNFETKYEDVEKYGS